MDNLIWKGMEGNVAKIQVRGEEKVYALVVKDPRYIFKKDVKNILKKERGNLIYNKT